MPVTMLRLHGGGGLYRHTLSIALYRTLPERGFGSDEVFAERSSANGRFEEIRTKQIVSSEALLVQFECCNIGHGVPNHIPIPLEIPVQKATVVRSSVNYNERTW